MITTFVFVMTITFINFPVDYYQYVGHFQSCRQAAAYVKLQHSEMVGSRCILEEYANLPEDTIKKEITFNVK